MTQGNPPTISVVMPLYNKGEYVETAIASALTPASPVHEIIVVDDGSTDDGPERVARIADPRVRLIRQANAGVSAARNLGIREASGEFIAFLDADDYWLPGYLPQIAELIHAYPQCGMFATRYFSFSEDGKTETQALHSIDSGGAPQIVTRFFEFWAHGNFFFTCSVVIPRCILLENGIFFPLNESLGEDQEVWFRVAELFPVAYSARPLVAYRTGTFPSLSKAATGDKLPPFISRLKARHDSGRIPPHHRKGVSRLLGHHQLLLAMKFMRMRRWTAAMSLLFDRFSIRSPKFWLKVLALGCLPEPLRVRLLDKG